MTSDPRHALARQVAVLAEKGLKPAGAFELEFFLLANERDADGRVQPAEAVLDGRKSGKTEVYSVDHLHGMEPLFSDIYASAAAQGIPAETVISEYAPGQYELTLNYRKDVLRAADDLVMLKRLVRAAARRHGVTACFMAKPIEKYAGSGMHFHVSLIDDAGRNVFAEAGRRKLVAQPAAGAGRACARPWPNRCWSLPRTPIPGAASSSQSYAPIAPTWGVNNRSVALRVPAGDAKNRRIEHRPSGVDANPYLVAATVLAGIAKGLDEELDPGPETTGNGYEERASGARRHAGRLARRDRGREGLGVSQAGARRGPAQDLHRDQAGRISARRPHGERTRLSPLSARGVSANARGPDFEGAMGICAFLCG